MTDDKDKLLIEIIERFLAGFGQTLRGFDIEFQDIETGTSNRIMGGTLDDS